MSADERTAERRRRIFTRTLPIVLLATAAFVVGILVGSGPDAAGAARFLDAWEQGNYPAMHAELTPGAQEDFPLEEFKAAYRDAAETATVVELRIDDPEAENGQASAAVELDTEIFGTLGGEIALPLADDAVAWDQHLVFPELDPGERLIRKTKVPRRAPILAADGSVLAEGPAAARTIPLAAAPAVVGEVGTPARAQARELAARGFPPGTPTGVSGLELAFDRRLAGKPGGQLLAASVGEEPELAGGRVLATSESEPGRAVRTTIDPGLQDAAVAALGGLYGGIAVLDARNGSVLGLSGLGYSAPQPPGSTFKIVTTTGALDAGIVKLSDSFPVETSNSDIGREISNSNDSPCGGTFAESFANSCNTVFAPLGAELGGERLVDTAERYGFNSTPALFDSAATEAVDPPSSTLPTEITSTVEAGETAIGQGQVLATPLQMASVAQTIANGGVRSPTPIAKGPDLAPEAEPTSVTSRRTATTIRDLMIGVVEGGTGTAAALPGVEVAGKSGTAELGPKALEPDQELEPGEEPPLEKDAWFVAFAPARKPSLVVAVMIVNAEGDGGVVAGPIAREVLASGLGVG